MYGSYEPVSGLSSYEPVSGFASYEPVSGLGRMPMTRRPSTGASVSPLVTAIQKMGYSGFGEDPATPTTPGTPAPQPLEPGLAAGTAAGASVAVMALAVLSIQGIASYYAGKAMAPNDSVRTKWGWYGAASGIFLGPLGLGILGGISLSKH